MPGDFQQGHKMKNHFFLLSLLTLSPLVHAEPIGDKNSPVFFRNITGSNMIMNYNELPMNGKLADDRLGWSETYWPSNKGGIAFRWNHPNPQPFRYKFIPKEDLMKMSQEELSQLSPAELYDISQGDYNYTITKTAFSLYNYRDLWWEGICHGWSMAASHYPEPDQVVVTNPDGIKVPFGASDVKGLLAMHDAYNFHDNTYAFVGGRCKVPGKVHGEGDSRDPYTAFPPEDQANLPECRDVNAGSFHIVLSNMIGIHGMGFVADIDRFNDVWNQPVTSYTSIVDKEEPLLLEHHALGVSKRIRVKTKMTYGEELKFFTTELAASGAINFVSKSPVTGTPHQEFRFKNYEYILELNEQGMIIGGDWISETRPDFMWIYGRAKAFKDTPMPLSGLSKIYHPVKRR
jgi:hypothetical protein